MGVLFVMMRSGVREVLGGERSTLTTARLLREAGVPVRFLMTAEDDLARETERAGFPFDVVPVDDPFSGVMSGGLGATADRLVRLLRLELAVAKIVRTHAVKVVHAAGVPAALGSRLGAWLAGAGLVYHIRGLSRRARATWFEELTILLADRTVAVSRSLKERMVETAHGPLRAALQRRIQPVYNGFALDELMRVRESLSRDEARRRLEVAGDAFLCLQVGSLDDVKRQLEVVRDTWPRVVAEVPGARIAFVGAAKEAAYLEACRAEVRARGVEASVTWVGHVPHAAVYPWFRAADVLVVSSQHEGLSRVAIEAHVMGLPVATLRIPGLLEIVEDGVTGVTVADGDFAGLAEAIVGLARDPARRERLGKAAASSGWERFSLERHRERILEVYRGLLG